MRGDPLQKEFADQIRHNGRTHARQTIADKQRRSAIGSGIIKIGNGSRGKGTEHTRVIRLLPPIITPGDHRRSIAYSARDPILPFPL